MDSDNFNQLDNPYCQNNNVQAHCENSSVHGDFISKRTRARLSLQSFTLEELESYLQASDEDDYFSEYDEEQEYQKFVVSVFGDDLLAAEEFKYSKRELSSKPKYENIRELLKENDCKKANSIPKKRGRPPRTKQKQFNPNGKNRNSVRHFRPLKPCLFDNKLASSTSFASSHSIKSSVVIHHEVFTKQQIGQLYSQINEHVQLLIQLSLLCFNNNSVYHQVFSSSVQFLRDIVQRRKETHTWKRTCFPNECFSSQFTQPSANSDLNGWKIVSVSSSIQNNSDEVVGEKIPWRPSVADKVVSIFDISYLSFVENFIEEIDSYTNNIQNMNRLIPHDSSSSSLSSTLLPTSAPSSIPSSMSLPILSSLPSSLPSSMSSSLPSLMPLSIPMSTSSSFTMPSSTTMPMPFPFPFPFVNEDVGSSIADTLVMASNDACLKSMDMDMDMDMDWVNEKMASFSSSSPDVNASSSISIHSEIFDGGENVLESKEKKHDCINYEHDANDEQGRNDGVVIDKYRNDGSTIHECKHDGCGKDGCENDDECKEEENPNLLPSILFMEDSSNFFASSPPSPPFSPLPPFSFPDIAMDNSFDFLPSFQTSHAKTHENSNRLRCILRDENEKEKEKEKEIENLALHSLLPRRERNAMHHYEHDQNGNGNGNGNENGNGNGNENENENESQILALRSSLPCRTQQSLRDLCRHGNQNGNQSQSQAQGQFDYSQGLNFSWNHAREEDGHGGSCSDASLACVTCIFHRFVPFFHPSLFVLPPISKKGLSRLLFTPAEDRLLMMGVEEFNRDWNAIRMRYLPTKSPQQIRLRYKNCCSTRWKDNPLREFRKRELALALNKPKNEQPEGTKYHRRRKNKCAATSL